MDDAEHVGVLVRQVIKVMILGDALADNRTGSVAWADGRWTFSCERCIRRALA